MTNSLALVPVFAGTINSQSVQLCDARTLHTFMIVLRDFTTWIKGRIRKFGFVEGIDFITVKNLSSPDLVSAKSRAQTLADYHLTLDMAKELAMVENNPKGREARRYFIDCEKRANLPGPAISPAQCQHLTELVDLVVASGRQKSHGETWARFHRKMKVNSYKLLNPAQFDAACQYLSGKLDDQSIATLIQKHLPNTAPAIPMKNALQALSADDRLMAALAAANEVAAKVQAVVFKAMLSGDERWQNERWMLSFNVGRDNVVMPYAAQIENDAVVMSLAYMAKAIMETGGMMPSNTELVNLAAACNQRLASRFANDVARAAKTSSLSPAYAT